MPFTVFEGAVVGSGMMLASAATFFYKRKKTLPFKVAYFLSWPTLGTAVMWAVSPTSEQMTQRMNRDGFSEEQLAAARAKAAAQMEVIREAAAGNPPR